MNIPVELCNITNDTGKSSNAQRSACITKFNLFIQRFESMSVAVLMSPSSRHRWSTSVTSVSWVLYGAGRSGPQTYGGRSAPLGNVRHKKVCGFCTFVHIL